MPVVAPLTRAWRFIPERVLTHLEELAYLWQRRRASIRSDSLTLRDFAYLNERIEAHVQGAMVAGAALDDIAGSALVSSDRDEVFAIGWALLRGAADHQVSRVLEVFLETKGGGLAGLGEALTLVPLASTEAALRDALTHGNAPQAAWASLALAQKGRLEADAAGLAGLLVHDQGSVAEVAWRAARCVDAHHTAQPRPYAEALRHADPLVVETAVETAIWTGQPWVLDTLWRLAAVPERQPWALGWLGALAPPDGQAAVLARISEQPAAQRGPLAARLGTCQALEQVHVWMASDDPQLAASALRGWSRMTGLSADGARVASPAGDDEDPVFQDLRDELVLPDLAKVRQLRDEHGKRWQGGVRWCRGHDIRDSLSREAQRWIDLEARWDFGARAALAGQGVIPPPPSV